MRQLITRIDDELHRRLRDRARAEDRSVAALVREVLERAVGRDDDTSMRGRPARSALVVRPDAPSPTPTSEDVLRQTRGAGTAVRAALASDRLTPLAGQTPCGGPNSAVAPRRQGCRDERATDVRKKIAAEVSGGVHLGDGEDR